VDKEAVNHDAPQKAETHDPGQIVNWLALGPGTGASSCQEVFMQQDWASRGAGVWLPAGLGGRRPCLASPLTCSSYTQALWQSAALHAVLLCYAPTVLLVRTISEETQKTLQPW